LSKASMSRPRPPITDNLGDHYTMTNEVLGQGYFAVVKVGIDKKRMSVWPLKL